MENIAIASIFVGFLIGCSEVAATVPLWGFATLKGLAVAIILLGARILASKRC